MNKQEKTCHWYPICPIKYFVDNNKLDRKWVEDYCLVGNKKCVRYQMEENGQYHPDNMLPNGEIKEDLF
ncbi:MAG: uracil-DNA glycosylase [Promethearchaeota archaeon]